MPDSRQRLIEAATRPFSDNAEMKLAAKHLLAEQVKPNARDSEEAIQRWGAVDAEVLNPKRRVVIWAVLVAVSAMIWLSQSGEIIGFFKRFSEPEKSRERIASRLNDHQKHLLFGDGKARWESDPDNPIYFVEYAQSGYLTPNDLIKTARRIDPGNAWFTYLAAAKSTSHSYTSGFNTEQNAEAMKFLREARDQPKCTDYVSDRFRPCLPLVPQRNSLEYLDSLTFASPPTFIYMSQGPFENLADVIVDTARSMADRGDQSGFHELTIDAESFLRRVINNENVMIARERCVGNQPKTAVKIAEGLSLAADKLELPSEASRWKTIKDRLNALDDVLENKEDGIIVVDGKKVKTWDVTGVLLGRVIRRNPNRGVGQTLLKDQDLKPGRMVDHEILSWLCAAACSILIGLSLGGVTLFRFRISPLSRRLGGRMQNLLRPKDWTWILGLGVLLPFAWMMVINRQTPLGGRESGILANGILLPGVHFFGLLVLWLVVPLQVIRWRLARRAGSFGFTRPSWMSWLAVACAVAFVPLAGWACISQPFGGWIPFRQWVGWKDLSSRTWLAVVPLGVCLSWLFWGVSQAIFGQDERQLYHATSSRILTRVLVVAMLVLALAAPAFKASERFWFAQDKLSKIDPALPAWSVYEYKVAEQQKKELREILEYEP